MVAALVVLVGTVVAVAVDGFGAFVAAFVAAAAAVVDFVVAVVGFVAKVGDFGWLGGR